MSNARTSWREVGSPARAAQHRRDHFMTAVRNDDLSRIELMVQRNESLVEVRWAEAETPLHVVAKRGQVSCARTLLKHGADADATDMSDRTPLYIAAKQYDDNSEMLKLLVGEGAGVNHAAEGQGNGEPLHAAAQHGHINNVRSLIALGANVNAENAYHNTALHFVLGRHAQDPRIVPVLRVLLNAGAHPDGTDMPNGYRPLHKAMENDNWEAVCMLLAFGANPTLKYGTWAPIDWAKDRPNRQRAVELLQQHPIHWKPQYHYLMPKNLDEAIIVTLLSAHRLRDRGRLPHFPPEIWDMIFCNFIPSEFAVLLREHSIA